MISEDQTKLADRALALRDRNVSMEMVPWNRVAFISADIDSKLREEFIKRHNFTRMPVVAVGGKVIGVMSILDVLLTPERTTRQITEAVGTLRPDTRVHHALRTMRRERWTMAIVSDPDTGRPLGLVTLKDLVEPLIGELSAW